MKFFSKPHRTWRRCQCVIVQSLRQTAGGAFCTDRSGVSFRRQLCYRLSGARWWYPQLQVGTLGRRLTDVDRRDLIHPPTRWLPELKQTPKRCGRDDSTNGERGCMRTPPGPSISRIAYISTDAHCRLAHGQSAQTQLGACVLPHLIPDLHVSDEANFTHPILAKGKYRAGQKGTTVWRLWPAVRPNDC